MLLYNIPIQWMYWAEFALVLILLFINVLQPHVITNSLRTIVAPVGRRYDDGNSLLFFSLLQGLFIVGVLSLTSLVMLQAIEGIHAALNWQQIVGIFILVLIVVLLKCAIDKWMNYVFHFSMHAPNYLQYRYIVWQISSIALLGYLVISPLLHATALWVIPLVILVLYLILIGWKLLSSFGISLDHIAYLIIYMLHAEVLPLAGIVAGTHYLVHISI